MASYIYQESKRRVTNSLKRDTVTRGSGLGLRINLWTTNGRRVIPLSMNIPHSPSAGR